MVKISRAIAIAGTAVVVDYGLLLAVVVTLVLAAVIADGNLNGFFNLDGLTLLDGVVASRKV